VLSVGRAERRQVAPEGEVALHHVAALGAAATLEQRGPRRYSADHRIADEERTLKSWRATDRSELPLRSRSK
jgi:hypothetical protein